MQKTNFKTLDLCMIGVVTAVIVIMAQISIPMPLGVPMTMQTFAITLAGIILGSKKGAVASLIYVLTDCLEQSVFPYSQTLAVGINFWSVQPVVLSSHFQLWHSLSDLALSTKIVLKAVLLFA
ncbi:MAG: biotin transporter BioY [Coprococcus phoceensis]